MCVCGFYGAYRYHDHERLVSRFMAVSGSVYGACRILDYWSRVMTDVLPPRCGKASKRPLGLSWERRQVIGSLAHGVNR